MNHNDVLSSGEHYVAIRGVKLWYFVQGSGPILLVQPGGAGWGGDASPYIETLKPLEKIRTVVYLEPRGIGRSQRLREIDAYKMDEYVQDIESLRRYFGTPQIAIAGHSHGGFVAMKYAIKYPKKVECLILIDTTPYIHLGDYNQWLKKRKGHREALVAFNKLQGKSFLTDDDKERAILQTLLPIIHFHNYDKVSSQVNELLASMIVSAEPHRYYVNKEGNSYDLRESVKKVTAPTLIVTGDDDMPHIVLGSKLLHKQIPNASLVIIENCGHWPMIEAPEPFFKAVIPFLSH